MSQTLGETMMASFMASTKEIPDIFILVVVEGFTPLPLSPRPASPPMRAAGGRGRRRRADCICLTVRVSPCVPGRWGEAVRGMRGPNDAVADDAAAVAAAVQEWLLRGPNEQVCRAWAA